MRQGDWQLACRTTGSRAGPADEPALPGDVVKLGAPERPIAHTHALLRSLAVDVALEGEQGIHALAAATRSRLAPNCHGVGGTGRARREMPPALIVVPLTVPVPASMAPP